MIDAMMKSGNLVDPLTRKHLRSDVSYNNIAVENAVRWYSMKNPEITFMSDNREIEI